MSKRRLVVGFSIVFWILVECGQALAQRDGMPVGYPQSLESDLQLLLSRLRGGSPSPQLLVQVSSTYFDLADDLLTDEASRRAAYEAGAKAARRAFELDESNADAHFFTQRIWGALSVSEASPMLQWSSRTSSTVRCAQSN